MMNLLKRLANLGKKKPKVVRPESDSRSPEFSFQEKTISCRTHHFQFFYREPNLKKTGYGAFHTKVEGKHGWMEYELLSSKYDDLNLLGHVGARIPISDNEVETGFEKKIEGLKSSYNRLQQSGKSIDEIVTEIDEELLQIIKKFDAQVPLP